MNPDGTTKIYLGGALGQKFGKEWNLYVNSPAEAIKAININTGGKLKQYLSGQGHNKFYKVSLKNNKNSLNMGELKNCSGNQDIYISPVARGRKSGWGKILAAIVIILVAYWSGGTSLFAGNFGSQILSGITMFGVSMLLGGIVQLLTPTASFDANANAGASGGSNLFQGNATAIAQGGAVALVYGRALVTPMPISISFTNYNQSPSVGGAGTNTNFSDFPGIPLYIIHTTYDPSTGLVIYTQDLIPTNTNYS